MKKVLVMLSGDENYLDEIKTGLIANDVLHIDYLETHRLHERDQKIHYDLVIFCCEHLTEALTNHLLHFASRLTKTQVLLLARQISVYAYRQVGLMRNVLALQTPFEYSLYEEVIRHQLADLTSDISVRFPRFVTNEPARMVVMDTGILITTRMRNYSTGGAFLEYKGISIRVGQSVQLSLGQQEVKQAKDFWQLGAKVIWIREGLRTGTSQGVGVKFNDDISAVA
ncbi:MAG: PilZ domain-containing protein [Bdellovibrionaceae bacterium]|nr:PilZ domain-containing protein [Pseudobdellovibrionaceae bacterium]